MGPTSHPTPTHRASEYEMSKLLSADIIIIIIIAISHNIIGPNIASTYGLCLVRAYHVSN